tara:strand:- start:2251 stop:2514 length:264 start_codon:yes stop_codon:yes gene_type:complete
MKTTLHIIDHNRIVKIFYDCRDLRLADVLIMFDTNYRKFIVYDIHEDELIYDYNRKINSLRSADYNLQGINLKRIELIEKKRKWLCC